MIMSYFCTCVLAVVTEINIFLKNQVVVCLEVPDAHMVTSRDLLAMIFDEPEIGLPHEAEDTFALWFISPLFGKRFFSEFTNC